MKPERGASCASTPVQEKLAEAAAETLAALDVEAEEEATAPADPQAEASEPEEPHRD